MINYLPSELKNKIIEVSFCELCPILRLVCMDRLNFIETTEYKEVLKLARCLSASPDYVHISTVYIVNYHNGLLVHSWDFYRYDVTNNEMKLVNWTDKEEIQRIFQNNIGRTKLLNTDNLNQFKTDLFHQQ